MNTAWTWTFDRYDPKTEQVVEALCTLGNGRFATRGAAPESPADAVHYPGTYAAGCYNWLRSQVAGRQVGNEDMVNLPDWTRVRYRCLPEDGPAGEWLTPDDPSLRHHHVVLDLHAGTLTRRMLFQDGHGRRLGVTHTRLVHMADPHFAAQQSTFRAFGWRGTVEIQSVLDGDVTNAGVARYRALDGHHLTSHRAGVGADGIARLSCETTSSRIRIGRGTHVLPAPDSSEPELHRGGDGADLPVADLPWSPCRRSQVGSSLQLVGPAGGRSARVCGRTRHARTRLRDRARRPHGSLGKPLEPRRSQGAR